MNIHSIACAPTFGYNKSLNRTINKKLAESNDSYDASLLAMNKLCLSLEDKLRAAEKSRKRSLVEKYNMLFFTTKILVADKIEDRFPNLNYMNTELNDYITETMTRKLKKKEHWLNDIIEEFSSLLLFREGFSELDSIRMSGSETAEKFEERASEFKNSPSNGKVINLDDKYKEAETYHLELFVPSADSPKGFSSLGGMQAIKESLTDEIIKPIMNPEEAQLDLIEYGKKAPRGELFYGPPGCGKTAVVEALAMESDLPLYKLKIANAGSTYINESAINVQEAYNYLKDMAKTTSKPVLMLIDEIETLAPCRSDDSNNNEDNKIVGTLLQILEEAYSNNVIILCTTNYYDRLDNALRSRLENKVYIGLPDKDTRKQVLSVILSKRTKGIGLAYNSEELEKVAEMTEGFSNRDLVILTNKASKIARADGRRDIVANDYVIPINLNQNMKVKEELYRDKFSQKSIGFSNKS